VAFFACALCAACASDAATPRPQALVFVDTDLPSPRIADRIRIEVLTRESGGFVPACDGCAREVAIGGATDWPLSFGVEAPDDGSRRYVRAALFPVGRTTAGRALPESATEALVQLAFDDAIAAQEIFLGGACTGFPVDETEERSCVDGALHPIQVASARDPDTPSRVDSFRADTPKTCSVPARPETGIHDEDVCIEGGTFWMGDVRRQGLGANFDAVPEHLVTVSAFFIDRHEYSVARYQDAIARGFAPTGSPVGTPLTSHPNCTYVDQDETSMADYPLNCLRPFLAEELCAFDGKRLPTEAEWEWVAGNGEAEQLHPWGDVRTEETTARDGPVPVGTRAFDVTSDGRVHDMAWNLIEWVADDFQTYDERCWVPGNYGVDPHCIRTADDLAHGRSARGGYWLNAGDPGGSYRAMAPNRQMHPEGLNHLIGFRCARDG
jgi:formylglycine-generating enzyme required for sulfatase activity